MGISASPQMTFASDQGTLDEPVSETILRDLRQIGIRLKQVLIPSNASDQALRNWDLWGPLIFCLMLAMSMSFGASDADSSLVFTAVFVIVCGGSAVVTVNAALLGGKISFFQSVCVLGYCLFPLNIVEFTIKGSLYRSISGH